MLNFDPITDFYLDAYMDAIKYKLIDSKASGRLIASVDKKKTETGGQIEAFKYFGAVVHGRVRTSPTGPYDYSDKTVQERVRQWIDEKPITPRDGISKDSLAYLIARKIHREGFKATSPQALDIINDPELTREMEGEFADHVIEQVLKQTEIFA